MLALNITEWWEMQTGESRCRRAAPRLHDSTGKPWGFWWGYVSERKLPILWHSYCQ